MFVLLASQLFLIQIFFSLHWTNECNPEEYKNINDVYKILGLSYLKLSKFDEAKINLHLLTVENCDKNYYKNIVTKD